MSLLQTKKSTASSSGCYDAVRLGGWSSESGQGVISVTMNAGAFPGQNHFPVADNRVGVDFVFMQMLAAARYVTISPDIIALEEIIRTQDEQQQPPATRDK
jgi:hypothetical protein